MKLSEQNWKGARSFPYASLPPVSKDVIWIQSFSVFDFLSLHGYDLE